MMVKEFSILTKVTRINLPSVPTCMTETVLPGENVVMVLADVKDCWITLVELPDVEVKTAKNDPGAIVKFCPGDPS